MGVTVCAPLSVLATPTRWVDMRPGVGVDMMQGAVPVQLAFDEFIRP